MAVCQYRKIDESLEVLASARCFHDRRCCTLKLRAEPCGVDTQHDYLSEQCQHFTYQLGLEIDLHLGLGYLKRTAGQLEPRRQRQIQTTAILRGIVNLCHAFKNDSLLRQSALNVLSRAD